MDDDTLRKLILDIEHKHHHTDGVQPTFHLNDFIEEMLLLIKQAREAYAKKEVANELRAAERGFIAGLDTADEATKYIMQPIIDVVARRAARLEKQLKPTDSEPEL